MKITRAGKTFCELTGLPDSGKQFPDFEVLDANNQTVHLHDLIKNSSVLISVVPDINTSVCSMQTKKFNEEVDQYDAINFVTISTNSVEQQKHWCAAENVKKMEMLSDKNLDFGKQTGLLMGDSGLLARSVWVVDQHQKTVYSQVVAEMTNEPNYDAVLDSINQN